MLLGVENEGHIKPAGLMEFMVPEARKQFYAMYRDYIQQENEKFIYMDPKIKCRVKFRNYTKAEFLRIPSFVEYIS